MTITLTREEAQQVLDALEAEHSAIYGTSQTVKATELLRTRLAQPEPEPVAWVENLTDAQPHAVTDLKYCSVAQHERGEHLKYIPLYADPTPCQTCEALARTVMMDQTSHDTAPPQREWQGLTDEDIEQIHYGIKCKGIGAYSTNDIYRAIEAKLKEKNHAV